MILPTSAWIGCHHQALYQQAIVKQRRLLIKVERWQDARNRSKWTFILKKKTFLNKTKRLYETIIPSIRLMLSFRTIPFTCSGTHDYGAVKWLLGIKVQVLLFHVALRKKKKKKLYFFNEVERIREYTSRLWSLWYIYKQIQHSPLTLIIKDEPKIQFEQYPTTPHLAARMLYTADTVYNDIEDKSIGDFGSGCGILSIAANILGAGWVYFELMMYFILKSYNRYSVGFDIDPDAIKIAQENSDQFEVLIDFVNTDLLHAKLERFQGKLDTIIMNPPFGTKNNKGIDMLMLKKAIDVSFGCLSDRLS